MKQLKLLFASCLLLCAGTMYAQKYVGGDISLLPDYENANAKYKDQNGSNISGDMIQYFKQQGWNAMRVRLFVDPSKASTQHQNEGVRQDLDYVKALGRRIKEAGLAFMLDSTTATHGPTPASTRHQAHGPALTRTYWRRL